MTPELATHEDHRSSTEIESEIRKTRGRMDSTLDELGNRLSARSLMNTALDWWDAPTPGNQGSAAVKKAAVSIASQARKHPMPALLIGAGVAWLISESVERDDDTVRPYSPPDSPRFRSNGDADTNSGVGEWVDTKVDSAKDAASAAIDSIRGKSHEVGERVQEATGRMEERAHHAMDQGKTAVRRVGHELKGGYQAAADKFTVACDEYPLAVGVAFAALGALAGVIIPRTRREDEFMGERSDQLMEDTKDKANELLQTGKEMGSKVLETVKTQASEEGFTASGVSETLTDLAERGTRVLQQVKAEAVHVAEEKGIKLSTPPSEQTSDPQFKPVRESVGSVP